MSLSKSCHIILSWNLFYVTSISRPRNLIRYFLSSRALVRFKLIHRVHLLQPQLRFSTQAIATRTKIVGHALYCTTFFFFLSFFFILRYLYNVNAAWLADVLEGERRCELLCARVSVYSRKRFQNSGAIMCAPFPSVYRALCRESYVILIKVIKLIKFSLRIAAKLIISR